MKVKDVMIGEVKTCSTNDDLARAAQIMWEHDCGVVPVVEADEYVVGMITDRDACMAAYTRGLPLNAIRVGDVMSRQVKSIRAEEDAGMATAAMREQRVRRVPVVDALGRLVGIVSLGDLARRAAGGNSKGLSRDAVAETLGSVCRPWTQSVSDSVKPQAASVKDGAVLRPQRTP